MPTDPPVSLTARNSPAQLAIEPLLVGAREAARLLAISTATFWRWDASGTLGPRGYKRGGKRLWALAELKLWIERGLLPRKEWEALQAAQRNGRA